MKHLLYTSFLISMLYLLPRTAHAQWVEKYTSVGPDGGLYDLDFFQSDTGIVCGFNYNDNQSERYGLIVRSTDRGHTWTKVNAAGIHSYEILFSVSCASRSVAYASAQSVLFKTTDAGLTWDSLNYKIDNASPSAGDYLNDLKFTDPDHGLATIGQWGVGFKLVRTNDGGLNWNTCLLQPGYIRYHSRNTETINLIAGDTFYTTQDSGTAWQKYPVPSYRDTNALGHAPYYPRVIYFQNATTGYLTNGPFLLKSTNSGHTWTKFVVDPTDSFNLLDVQFTDALNGFITTEGGMFYRTTDGGNTWQKVFVDNGIPRMYQLDLVIPYYFDKDSGCVLAEAGDVNEIQVNDHLQAISTGVNEIQVSSNPIKVYPNPASDFIIVETSGESRIAFYDLSMKELSVPVVKHVSGFRIETQSLQPGMYFIQITNQNGSNGWAHVLLGK